MNAPVFTSCVVMEAAGVLGRCLLLCLAFLAVSAEVSVHWSTCGLARHLSLQCYGTMTRGGVHGTDGDSLTPGQVLHFFLFFFRVFKGAG